jgi:hypothetical protein
MRPSLIVSSAASNEAVTLGSRVAGLVTHVPKRISCVLRAITVSSG